MTSISIVTPTYNRAEFIEAAIESALKQSVGAYEHIIIDGASSDDTLARLRKYPDLHIISEPDSGLYDALNKGIRRATGDVICLLNSDDRLLPGAFDAVIAAFADDPGADAVCGRIRIGDPKDGAADTEIGCPVMQQLRAGDVISGLPITNGRFIRRTVFERMAPFDQTFPVLADREFLGRFWLGGFRTRAIDHAVYRYGAHQQSLSFGAGTGQLAYNTEAVGLASARLERSTSEGEQAFYRRWLGWAIGYTLARGAMADGLQKARVATAIGRSSLPGWPMEFAAQAAWHWSTRAERRGRAAQHVY